MSRRDKQRRHRRGSLKRRSRKSPDWETNGGNDQPDDAKRMFVFGMFRFSCLKVKLAFFFIS